MTGVVLVKKLCALLLAVYLAAPAAAGKKLTVGYFASWADWNPSQGALSGIPSYVSTVVMAFAQPDMTFTPGKFTGTGLQYHDQDYNTVKNEIKILKNKGTTVLLAVGGASYSNWAGLNATALVEFANAMCFSGIDVDYEPAFDSVSCTTSGGVPTCNTDSQFDNAIATIRAALPRPAILSIAAFSIGAYGWGNYTTAQPQGSHTGMSYHPCLAQGAAIDLVNVMSYDADNQFSPILAYKSYRDLLAKNGEFTGEIAMGVEVPPECCGHTLTLAEVTTYADWLNANNGGGAMLWYLGPRKTSVPSPTQVMQAFCTKFALGGCDHALFTCDGCSNVVANTLVSLASPNNVTEAIRTAEKAEITAETLAQDAAVVAEQQLGRLRDRSLTYGQPNITPPEALEPLQG